MRIEYITTKVRPIKKLFIIELYDYEGFANFFTKIQSEVDIIQNLIFVNDDDLWSQTNIDFIKRSDPDIILNLSKIDNNRLSLHFGISSVNPFTETYKIERFSTNIFSFSRLPAFLKKLGGRKNRVVDVYSASKLENTEESLLACINYGLFPVEIKELLSSSIFNKLKITYFTKKEEILNSIFKHHKKFIQLTTYLGGFGGFGFGSNIYEIDYNTEKLFNDGKKYFFISDKNDFKTITFFWNIRSYYSNSDIAWIPIEFLEDISQLIDSETIFICFYENIKIEIQNKFASAKIIHPSRLYFSGKNNRWAFFEHNQTVSITDNEVIILHPEEKNFLDLGSIGAYVLEVSGLEEFTYPKRRNIGKLFFPKNYDHDLFAGRFLRISEFGLSMYKLDTSFLSSNDISELIVLPTLNEVIHNLFEDVGFTIKTTPKSSIFEQTVNLLGGVNELNIISVKHIFKLLVDLTPKVRSEQIVKNILDGIGNNIYENVFEIIGQIRDNGAINFPSVTLTIEEILNRTSVDKNEKKNLFPVLQKLYDLRILLRGKYFECPSCGSKLWLQIDEINRVNYCIDCSNLVNIPMFSKDKQDSDYYRLNQLIVRAVDQGQISTILLLNLFFQQRYRAFNYQSNFDIFKDGVLITDIDLFIKIGKKIGIAECKSTSGFAEEQLDKFIEIASTLQCDFIVFSSLIDSSKKEIKDLVEILNKKSLNIPAFVVTNEALFNPKPNIIQKYFELWRGETFQVGPIIIGL